MRLSQHAALLTIGSLHPVLLWDDTERILVDTGLPGQFELLEQAVTAEGFSVAELTKVIITHQDIDHIGCVKEIFAAAPGIEVIAHPLEAPYLDGRKTPLKLAGLQAAPNLTPELKQRRSDLKRGFAARRFQVARSVKNGETWDCCGGIEILHTPGHTPGHLCLFLRESSILVAGDELNANNGALSGPNPAYTPDMPLAFRSLRPLCELNIDRIVCYHGGLVEKDAAGQLRQVIASDPYEE